MSAGVNVSVQVGAIVKRRWIARILRPAGVKVSAGVNVSVQVGAGAGALRGVLRLLELAV